MSIKGQDGLVAFQGSQVDVTFDGETSLFDILNEAVAQFGLPLGSTSEIPDIRFPDYTFHGDASDLMDRIAEMAGSSLGASRSG